MTGNTLLQADEADLLAECVDDYVCFWSVLWNIRHAHPGASPGEVRESALEVVRRLLFNGLITAGGFEHGGDDFRPWDCGRTKP